MEIRVFLEKNNIVANNYKLFVEAFTHKSYSNEHKNSSNYQRLEFLGDAIIEKNVSEYLFNNFPDMSEGNMTLLRSKVVSGTTLANLAIDLEIDKYIRFGNNSKDFNSNSKIYADVFESLVGAIYLDQGEVSVKELLSKTIFKLINEFQDKNVKNPKTILQEYLQLESRGTIRYESTIKNDGSFNATVYHEETRFGSGDGKTKKEAEVNAAKDALKLLGKVK